MSTKMPYVESESKSNKITLLEQAWKVYYRQALMKRGITQEEEGFAIWKDQTAVQLYLSTTSHRNLTVPDAVKSEVVNDIIKWMAEQVGGYFTPFVGKLNGSHKDELATILKAASIITESGDNETVVKAQFEIIMEAATRGSKDAVAA